MGSYDLFGVAAVARVMAAPQQLTCLSICRQQNNAPYTVACLCAVLQALWTQAREQLQVLTIICANNTYAILKVNSSSMLHNSAAAHA
jgi:hypothetical protein